MSWLFSQVLAEEYSAGICSDGEPFAQLNVMPTEHKFWRNDKMMEHSKLSQFGLTLKLLTEQDGEALLMSYLADFRARISVSQEKGKESKALDRACGLSSLASFAKFSLDSSTWKTPQLSLLEDSEEFLETWPKSGLMQNGECWEQATLAPLMKEKESGLWQTPVADDAANRTKGKFNSRGEPKLSAQVLMPTPTTQDNVQIRGEGSAAGKDKRGTTLGGYVVKFPTPTATEYGSNKGGSAGRSGKERLSLTSMARKNKWPTPTARDYKGGPTLQKAMERKENSSRGVSLPEELVRNGQPGRLNPEWVEWLMGWPIGWTELKPLETGRFQEWLRQHLPSYTNS